MVLKAWNRLAILYHVINWLTDFFRPQKDFVLVKLRCLKVSMSWFSIYSNHQNRACDMISMWKHNSKRLQQVSNVASCCKLVDWLFSDLKKILYWWSYGVWKSPGNDFPFILITKNRGCDMITMWIHNSKRLKQVGNVVSYYKLVDWLFSDLKMILYWWSYGVWKSPGHDFPFILITKNSDCDMI